MLADGLFDDLAKLNAKLSTIIVNFSSVSRHITFQIFNKNLKNISLNLAFVRNF